MAEGKKSFVLYSDVQGLINQLPDEIAGKLLKHIYAYVNDENPVSDNLLLNVAFEPIKQQLKRDLKKWDDTRVTRKESGKLGGLKSGEARRKQKEANEANALNSKQSEANEAVSVNVNDNVNVKKKKVFIPPSFLEFENYCKENGFGHIAKKAFTGYDVAGWVDSKGNKVLNWKQKLNNVWFSESNKKFDTSIREGSTLNAEGKRIVV